MNLAYCYIENNASAVDQCYVYQFFDEKVEPAKRVLVHFKNRDCVAFVEHVELNVTTSFSYEIKPILKVIDETPILNNELVELAKWMSKTNISTVIGALQTMLPSQLKAKLTHKKVLMEKWVRPIYDGSKTSKQKEVYTILVNHKEMKRSEWLKLSSVSKTLETLGCVEVFEKEKKEIEDVIEKKECPFELNDEQKNAVSKILNSKSDVVVLKGVTGSGKTEVFLHSAQEVIKQGKQVLFLVPEISLTPMMVKRVKERFGNEVAIYHSSLSDQQKYEQYQSVKRHEKNIVVGTRSAVFMPFDQLGLIILDEEHDLSYKQAHGCRYHARDVAIHRGKTHHARVVLASATPSLDTMARALKNVYDLVEMKHRVNHCLPEIKLIDMNHVLRRKQSYILSNDMIHEMKKTLDSNKQVILLLNRRGYQPILRCKSCGKVLMCPHCDKPLVVHKTTHSMNCHLCSATYNILQECPECHGKLSGSGFGTQMLEEKVQEIFPQARIIRMDADTTSRKDAHEKLLTKFGNHEADILLGTQMIAKGLDFENVILVGILQGDAMLMRSDYRSAELAFDLLMQASGRSGRGASQGKVLIQAYEKDHYAIKCAIKQDYDTFFKHEMNYRHLASYPPYSYLCALTFVSKNETEAYDEAYQTMQSLKEEFKVLGVSELLKIQDEKRYRICVKSKDLEKLQASIYNLYQIYRKKKTNVSLIIDMNPLTLED